MRTSHRSDPRTALVVTAVFASLMALLSLPADKAATRPAPAQPACVILDNAGKPARNLHDPLAKLLSAKPCPANAFELRTRLQEAGAKIKTTLVANRGFHNPAQGSFSMFEIVTGRLTSGGAGIADGEFFFGHFTARTGASLIASQPPSSENLMIELIAWDPEKKVFNFYEELGDGRKGLWFYRGDSLDIMADLTSLHRPPTPGSPQFGKRLRCSGCHLAGGPIMKEMALPHNDWWMQERTLPFGGAKPDATLSGILAGLVDATELAHSVQAGMAKLRQSETFREADKKRSLPERLRPLFCPVELNLASDPAPMDQKAPRISIPSAFLVNPMLARGDIDIAREHYDAALTTLKSAFPEALPARRDGDHGWLTPVKAFSDTQAIEALIEEGLIDREFVMDVLAVDMTNPLFSTGRCGLLRLLPPKADTTWRNTFQGSLQAAAPGNPAARELHGNLTTPSRDTTFHQTRATALLAQSRKQAQSAPAVIDLLRLLAQRRAEARASAISQNRLGQILEPNFRVIFPGVNPAISPGTFQLTEDGRVVRR
ncbi:MAG: hypothetical protein ACKV2V_27335 [Blastocatellia bacterium]